MQILAPYLINPFILISLFLVLGVFTPLIEETLKPAIVWLLAKRLQRPSQGFALGVISGAGFALVESLLASSTPGQGWGQLLAVARRRRTDAYFRKRLDGLGHRFCLAG